MRRRHAPYCPYCKKKRHISRRFFLCPPCCFRPAFLPCFFRENIHLFIPKISATEPYLFSLLSEIRIHTAKHSLNRLISQLRPSVFIHDSLIIHSSRPAAEPAVTHVAVAELPEINAAATLLPENRLQLFFNGISLVFLRPFYPRRCAATIDGARARLRYQKRLSCAFRFLLNPVIKAFQVILYRRVMIP